MQNTKNYGLNKPESTDFYKVSDFNENMDIIDEKLKGAEESVKAEANNRSTADNDLLNKLNTHIHDISNGGTGATTAKEAEYNISGGMEESTITMKDTNQIVFKVTTPSSTEGVFVYKKASMIWDYIKSKISSVLGLTATSYSGKASSATNADYATRDSEGNIIYNHYAFKSHEHSEYASTANPVFTGGLSVGNSTASGENACVIGSYLNASGVDSFAQGNNTNASGNYSHAGGYNTKALTNQFAQGHYNDTSLATANSTSGTSDGTIFVLGNGTGSGSGASNALRVTGQGAVYAKSAYNSTGADYAEFAEWADGNPDNEDRRGYFVTFDEEKPEMIRKANAGDDVLGIVSGNPCIIGNADEGWLGKYVFDEFGSIVYEEVEEEIEYLDKETGEIETKTELVTTYKINPDFDPTQQYTHRKDRQEWDYVGWIGVLSVRDDGTCVAGGYCTVADGGTATSSERGADTYRVLKRVSDNVIKVAFKP